MKMEYSETITKNCKDLHFFCLKSLIVLLVDLVIIIVFPNLALNFTNVLMFILYSMYFIVSIYFTRKNQHTGVYQGIETEYFFSLKDKSSIIKNISYFITILVVFNFFFLIWERVLTDVYNMVFIIKGEPIKNLIIFYISLIFYGTANISVPVIIAYESRKLNRIIRNFLENNEKVTMMSTSLNDIDVDKINKYAQV